MYELKNELKKTSRADHGGFLPICILMFPFLIYAKMEAVDGKPDIST